VFSFDESSELRRVFQSRRITDDSSSLDLNDPVVPTRLDGLAVETQGGPKDAAHNFSAKVEPVRGDQRDTFKLHSADYVLKESEPVSIASSPYDSRRPEPRPDVNRGEDPNRLFFATDDRPNLVCLKLLDDERSYFSIVEPTTNVGCLFKPAIDGIPGDPLYSGDRGLVQAFDAQHDDFVERRATVLESIIRCAGVRAERLSARPAPVSTTLP
jgi:hypothetical protein